jgi:hypothetical protein
MFLTDSPDVSKETFMDVGGFPGWKHQIVVSGVMFMLACAIFVMLLHSNAMFEVSIISLLTAAIIFLAMGLPQFLDFQKMQREILTKGFATKQGEPGRKKGFGISLSLGFFLVIVFGPFVLLFVAPPVLWFGCVLGMIGGFSAAQFSLSLYIRRWETKHKRTLNRFTKWCYDERQRRVVLEYGVRGEPIE